MGKFGSGHSLTTTENYSLLQLRSKDSRYFGSGHQSIQTKVKPAVGVVAAQPVNCALL